MNQLHDQELVELLEKGNRIAFNEIYGRYWKHLYNYIFNILNDGNLTEDVLQETFINVWSNKRHAKIQNLKSYLFSACRNNAISKIRQVKFTRFQLDLIETLSIEPEADLHFNAAELKQTIEEATEALPARCRQIFFMSRFDHLSIQEIATKLNISSRTVENQLSIALKHLRPIITDSLYMVVVLYFL